MKTHYLWLIYLRLLDVVVLVDSICTSANLAARLANFSAASELNVVLIDAVVDTFPVVDNVGPPLMPANLAALAANFSASAGFVATEVVFVALVVFAVLGSVAAILNLAALASNWAFWSPLGCDEVFNTM